MNWQINKRMLAGLAMGVFLSTAIVTTSLAWYPSSPYANPYRAYAPEYVRPYPYYWRGTHRPGFYGYTQPRWYMRGRMNRYGDYRVDIRVRNINMADMYTAWLLFNNYGY